MSEYVMDGIAKAMMMKEALASSQMEGIGLDLTLADLYLQELKDSLNTGSGNGGKDE